MHEAELRNEMVRLCKSLFDRGFTVGSSGNVSAALPDGYLVTPTNSCMGFLEPDRLAKIALDGRLISGDPPSKEVFLHRAYYESRPGTGAVVHLHSTYATALSCLAEIDPEDCIPAITPYVVMRVGRVKRLDYVAPGDPAMGEMIRRLEGRFAAVLLANHGPVVAGKDLQSAVHAAEELEETARLVLLLRGMPVRQLTEAQVAELLTRFG
jgi:ribulose-5-phosphate 4-epimerase/fuculose-1-phosphate aldolase